MPASCLPPANPAGSPRRRDDAVGRFLASHPATASMLTGLGWFPSVAKARRRLRRLAARGQVRLLGTVSRKAGRPEHVFGGWRPARGALLHEVELTELCLRIDAGEVRRGPSAIDPALRPDAELTINGERYLVEYDRGTEGYRQVERRLLAYVGCPDFVLWVCPTLERREGMRSRAGGLRATALFATREDAVRDPNGPVWIDIDGAAAALPRQRH